MDTNSKQRLVRMKRLDELQYEERLATQLRRQQHKATDRDEAAGKSGLGRQGSARNFPVLTRQGSLKAVAGASGELENSRVAAARKKTEGPASALAMTASNPTHRKTSIIELMRSISSGEVAEASIQEEATRHPGTLNSVSGDEDSEDGSEDFDVFEEEQQSKDGYGGMRQLSTKEKPPPWLDRSLRRPSESELQRPEMQSSPLMVNLDFSMDV